MNNRNHRYSDSFAQRGGINLGFMASVKIPIFEESFKPLYDENHKSYTN